MRHIKAAHPRHDTALTVTPDATLRDVQGIIRKRSHDMVLVVDDQRRLLGAITHADLRDKDQYTAAERIMTRSVVTLAPDTPGEDAFATLEAARVKAAPVVDADGRVQGVLTRDDTVRLEVLAPAVDADGKLLVAAAIGISSDASERAVALREIGVDALVLDTAHGHQRRMLEAIREVRAVLGDALPIVAGNVCTAEATRALIEAGADVVKVNVGPGAMCTTRMQTGAGRPTFTSMLECAREAERHGKHVWADGGARYPRDVALYLAAGASRVMVGTMLCGTHESPGDIREDREGRLYKVNFGMASARAVEDRSADLTAFERAKRALFREGISSSRVFLEEGRETVGAILMDMITGVQSSFTYVGAHDWRALQERAVVGVQTLAGYAEGTPRGQARRS